MFIKIENKTRETEGRRQIPLAPQRCGKHLCSSAPPFTAKCIAGSLPALCPDVQCLYPVSLAPFLFPSASLIYAQASLSLNPGGRLMLSILSGIRKKQDTKKKKKKTGIKNNKFEGMLISPFLFREELQSCKLGCLSNRQAIH